MMSTELEDFSDHGHVIFSVLDQERRGDSVSGRAPQHRRLPTGGDG